MSSTVSLQLRNSPAAKPQRSSIDFPKGLAHADSCHETDSAAPLNNVAYIYDGTTEGLLSSIFLAYANHENPQDIVREGTLQPRLGQSLVYVEANPQHAERVRKGILRKSDQNTWNIILDASLSDEPQAGTAIYQLVHLIMERDAARNQQIDNQLADPIAGPVIKLHKSVRNERHYMQQFLRFEHFEGDLWFARCNPKANVVPLLMDWFSARFNTQRFAIYDETHNIAGIYNGDSWYLVETADVHLPLHAPDEQEMQDAWKCFYDALSIPARYHPELRRQFMPKRFWKNILEVRDEPARTSKQELPQAESPFTAERSPITRCPPIAGGPPVTECSPITGCSPSTECSPPAGSLSTSASTRQLPQ